MTTIGQTSYTTSMVLAVAGMLADLYQDYDIVSYLCSENIPFGACVVLDTSTDANGNAVMLPKGTTTTIGKIAGVAMYVDTLENQLPGTTNVGHLAGTVIPVVRKGRVYALFAAVSTLTAVQPFTAPNIMHASDDLQSEAQYRGCFTTDATATTQSLEITVAPAGILFVRITGLEKASSKGVCLLDLNLPNS